MSKETKTMKEIRLFGKSLAKPTDDVFHMAKELLKIYRKVVWSLDNKANDMVIESEENYGKDLNKALIYLYEFAPVMNKESFENKISHLFETKWIMDLISKAMCKVKNYPDYGNEYAEILNLCYLGVFRYKETEILDMLSMERSSFYSKKKEAIQLFGICLWGYSLPEFQKLLIENNYMHYINAD